MSDASAAKLDVVARIEAAYEARWAYDYDLLLTGLAPDVRFRLIGKPGVLPFMGEFRGHEGVRACLRDIDAMFRVLDFHVDDVLVDRDRVAVRWTAAIQNRETDATTGVEAFDHIVTRDGLIVSFTEFFDTHALARVGRPA